MLGQMVWDTYLEKNCTSSNGHFLVFLGGLNHCPDGLVIRVLKRHDLTKRQRLVLNNPRNRPRSSKYCFFSSLKKTCMRLFLYLARMWNMWKNSKPHNSNLFERNLTAAKEKKGQWIIGSKGQRQAQHFNKCSSTASSSLFRHRPPSWLPRRAPPENGPP